MLRQSKSAVELVGFQRDRDDDDDDDDADVTVRALRLPNALATTPPRGAGNAAVPRTPGPSIQRRQTIKGVDFDMLGTPAGNSGGGRNRKKRKNAPFSAATPAGTRRRPTGDDAADDDNVEEEAASRLKHNHRRRASAPEAWFAPIVNNNSHHRHGAKASASSSRQPPSPSPLFAASTSSEAARRTTASPASAFLRALVHVVTSTCLAADRADYRNILLWLATYFFTPLFGLALVLTLNCLVHSYLLLVLPLLAAGTSASSSGEQQSIASAALPAIPLIGGIILAGYKAMGHIADCAIDATRIVVDPLATRTNRAKTKKNIGGRQVSTTAITTINDGALKEEVVEEDVEVEGMRWYALFADMCRVASYGWRAVFVVAALSVALFVAWAVAVNEGAGGEPSASSAAAAGNSGGGIALLSLMQRDPAVFNMCIGMMLGSLAWIAIQAARFIRVHGGSRAERSDFAAWWSRKVPKMHRRAVAVVVGGSVVLGLFTSGGGGLVYTLICLSEGCIYLCALHAVVAALLKFATAILRFEARLSRLVRLPDAHDRSRALGSLVVLWAATLSTTVLAVSATLPSTSTTSSGTTRGRWGTRDAAVSASLMVLPVALFVDTSLRTVMRYQRERQGKGKPLRLGLTVAVVAVRSFWAAGTVGSEHGPHSDIARSARVTVRGFLIGIFVIFASITTWVTSQIQPGATIDPLTTCTAAADGKSVRIGDHNLQLNLSATPAVVAPYDDDPAKRHRYDAMCSRRAFHSRGGRDGHSAAAPGQLHLGDLLLFSMIAYLPVHSPRWRCAFEFYTQHRWPGDKDAAALGGGIGGGGGGGWYVVDRAKVQRRYDERVAATTAAAAAAASTAANGTRASSADAYDDDDDDLFADVAPHHEKLAATFQHFRHRASRRSVIAVRGTEPRFAKDMLQNMIMFAEVCMVHLLTVLVPGGTLLPDSILKDLVSLGSASVFAATHHRRATYYHEAVAAYAAAFTALHPAEEVVLTGHSLGGSVAQLAAALSGRHQAFAFASPGITLLTRKFALEPHAANGFVTNVISTHDPIPQLGRLSGTVHQVDCGYLRADACHSTVVLLTRLWHECGDEYRRDDHATAAPPRLDVSYALHAAPREPPPLPLRRALELWRRVFG